MEMRTSGLKLNIGDKAPDFSLSDVDGKVLTLNDFKGKRALIIIFMCNHCPYVLGYLDRIKAIQSEYGIKGAQVIGINSNDEINYPDDSFEKMIEMSKKNKLNFSYLRDEMQETANAYGAQCTPECFIFDGHRHLKYHGRIDDNHKDANSAKTTELKNAVDAVIHDRKVLIELTPAIGCSIKWK